MAQPEAVIGIFGGSGFYDFLEDIEEVKMDTPFGPPSDKIALATYKGKSVAFLPRHGKTHSIPPHMINYRANLWAFKQLGVKFVISPCAAGSLQPHIHPGDFVVTDQFVDRTKGRVDTFYDGPITTHISGAEPYCDYLRQVACETLETLGIRNHPTGTVVVIQGPRFSTKAESRWFSKMGWDVVNMTQYPEVVLARELEMSFANIALVTDYDIGVEGVQAVTVEDMLAVFRSNMTRIREVLFAMIEAIDVSTQTAAHKALQSARFND